MKLTWTFSYSHLLCVNPKYYNRIERTNEPKLTVQIDGGKKGDEKRYKWRDISNY